jgi:hypothetical protein
MVAEDPIISTISLVVNCILVLVTGIYVYLTYKILKSSENIAKANIDPILWINPDAEGNFYIKKLKKFPAYNISVLVMLKFKGEKDFNILEEFYLGDLIDNEETYDIDIWQLVEDYIRFRKIQKSSFVILYKISYYTQVDDKPITRVEKEHGHSEVYNGEIMLGFSQEDYDKDSSLDGGRKPIKIIRHFNLN